MFYRFLPILWLLSLPALAGPMDGTAIALVIGWAILGPFLLIAIIAFSVRFVSSGKLSHGACTTLAIGSWLVAILCYHAANFGPGSDRPLIHAIASMQFDPPYLFFSWMAVVVVAFLGSLVRPDRSGEDDSQDS